MGMGTIKVGRVVVLRGQHERGAYRVERLLDVGGVVHARLLAYRDGRFSLVPLNDVEPCPPGTPAAGQGKSDASTESSG